MFTSSFHIFPFQVLGGKPLQIWVWPSTRIQGLCGVSVRDRVPPLRGSLRVRDKLQGVAELLVTIVYKYMGRLVPSLFNPSSCLPGRLEPGVLRPYRHVLQAAVHQPIIQWPLVSTSLFFFLPFYFTSSGFELCLIIVFASSFTIFFHIFTILYFFGLPNTVSLRFHYYAWGRAIKRPRTRSTAACQVSNAHERDLVTNQNV